MITYLFIERNDSVTGHKVRYPDDRLGSGSIICTDFTQWWGISLLLLYGLQCAVGFQAQRTPVRDRARTHSAFLIGIGVTIVVLAFYVAWIGFVAAGDNPLFCGILLIVSIVVFFFRVSL